MKVTNRTFDDIYDDGSLAVGAIIHNEMEGFMADYLCLHILLVRYNPATVLEIGTHVGSGTNIICNAVKKATVYSIDLPNELAHVSMQHPISCNKKEIVGERCLFPYKQIFANSLDFDYKSLGKIDAFFIDGEHTRHNVSFEAKAAIGVNAKLIIFHDADMPEVYDGIMDAFQDNGDNYDLFRITDTRILYALKQKNHEND